jgi:hypothetical protein
MVTLRSPSGASGYQQHTSIEAAMDNMLTQPSNIREVANPGVMATGRVHPLATATGSVGDGQLVALTGSGGGTTIVALDMTIPQESGGQTDMEIMGATSGVGHNQVLPGLDGGVHRVPAISLVDMVWMLRTKQWQGIQLVTRDLRWHLQRWKLICRMGRRA